GRGILHAAMGIPVWRRGGLHAVFRGLRISSLVHASSPTTARGAFGNFPLAQWASRPASSLHAHKFQRGVAAGGFVHGNAAVTVTVPFHAAARFGSAGCATQGQPVETRSFGSVVLWTVWRGQPVM